MSSRYNAADKPSRLDTKVEDIQVGSEWQNGMAYMLLPFCEWPWERKFASMKVSDLVPREELLSKYRNVAGQKISRYTTQDYLVEKFPCDYVKRVFKDGFVTNDYDVLIKRSEPFFRLIAKIRAGQVDGVLTLTSKELAVRYWFKVSMDATRVALAAGRLKELTILEQDEMLVIRGRAAAGMLVLLGAEYLPVLMASERLSFLLMLKSHVESSHKSVDITLFKSRQYCWIVGGRKLAKTICKLCIRCRYLSQKLESQKMAPLPKEICIPCPAFTNVGLDLAGPYVVKSMVKGKSTRAGGAKFKVWAVLIMCLNTRALKVYLSPGYGTDNFLLAWTEFIAECGVPRHVHSDRGTQLVSAAGELENLDYDWESIAGQNSGVVWKFCPAGSQWRNGAIESFVKRFKLSLSLYQDSGLNYAELQSTFKKVTSVLNGRPISARFGPRHAECDPDYLEFITPNMLLTGRTGIDLPLREFEDNDCPRRRLAYKEKLVQDWWNQWSVQCFDSLLPTKSWHTEKRCIQVGDVVLICYTDQVKTGTYKLGRVSGVTVDEDDLVRTCTVNYCLVRSDLPVEDLRMYFTGIKYKEMEISIQRLCVILPVEEQDSDWSSLVGSRKIVSSVSWCNRSPLVSTLDTYIGSPESDELVDLDLVQLNDPYQVCARQRLVASYRSTVQKVVKSKKVSQSVLRMHSDLRCYMDTMEPKVLEVALA